MFSLLEDRRAPLHEEDPVFGAKGLLGERQVLSAGILPAETGIRRRLALLASLSAEGSGLAAICAHSVLSAILLIPGGYGRRVVLLCRVAGCDEAPDQAVWRHSDPRRGTYGHWVSAAPLHSDRAGGRSEERRDRDQDAETHRRRRRFLCLCNSVAKASEGSQNCFSSAADPIG